MGLDVGPINVSTLSTYERKLFKLKTGKAQPQQKVYDPVEDDDDNGRDFFFCSLYPHII